MYKTPTGIALLQAASDVTMAAWVLLNDASAYPHGSEQPQVVREGGVVPMDCGCAVHDYQSDISRTWVMGEPTRKQREVAETTRARRPAGDRRTARSAVPTVTGAPFLPYTVVISRARHRYQQPIVRHGRQRSARSVISSTVRRVPSP